MFDDAESGSGAGRAMDGTLPEAALFAHADEAVIVAGADLRVRSINGAAHALLGTSAQPGHDFGLFIPERFRADHERHVAEFLASGQRLLDHTPDHPVVAVRADGDEVPVSASIVRLDAPAGPAFAVLMRPAAPVLAPQGALAASRAAIETGLGALESTVLLLSRDHRVLAASGPRAAAAEDLHAYCGSEIARGVAAVASGSRPEYRQVFTSGEGEALRWHLVQARGCAGPGETAAVVVATEITALKFAERELAIAAQVLASPVAAVVIIDAAGTVTFANRALLDLWGFGDERELIGQPHSILWTEGSLAANLPALLADCNPWSGEVTAVLPGGGTREVRLAATALTGAEGRPASIVATCVDLSGLREAERSIREHQEHLEATQKLARVGSWEWDLDTGAMAWAAETGRIAGLRSIAAGEGGYARLLAMVHTEDIPSFRQAIESAVRNRQPYTVDFRLLGRDGKVRWVRTSGSRRPGPGNVYSGFLQDINDFKEAERRRQHTRADLQAIFDGAADPITFLDRGFRVISTNEASRRVRRELYGREPLPGERFDLFLPVQSQESFRNAILRALAGEVVSREVPVTDIRGGERFFETTYRRVVLDSGEIRGVVMVSREVTERKRSEALLIQSQKLESLSVLAGGMAHDFNNLLQGIMGSAELLLADLPASSPARETAETIISGAQQAAGLARQMLAYAGGSRPVAEGIDLNQLVTDTVRVMRAAVNRGVVLDLRPAEALPPILGDPTQVRQVVVNLIVNASDAIGAAGGRVTITTRTAELDRGASAARSFVPEPAPGRYVELEVTDTGPGIAPWALGRVFDPFYTTREGGRGLGLAAALGIVRAHGGAIEAVSPPGAGATFRVFLRPSDSVRPSQKTPRGGGRLAGKVIVADDDDSVRRVASLALERLGLTVIQASDGDEMLALLRQHAGSVAAVLIDLTMPRMDGLSAAREAMAIGAGVPVVLMSGLEEHIAAGAPLSHGLAGFIQKPFGIDELRDVLVRALAGRPRLT